MQCAVSLGEYLEFLPPFLAVGGVKLMLRLIDAWRSQPGLLNDALRMLSSLLAHRRCVNCFLLVLVLASSHKSASSLKFSSIAAFWPSLQRTMYAMKVMLSTQHSCGGREQ